MNINEIGLGSNYHTLDNDPISRFNDPRISVEIFPDAWNNTSANVSCDALNYNSGVRKFHTEQEAKLFASNIYSELISRLNNELKERVIIRLLSL